MILNRYGSTDADHEPARSSAPKEKYSLALRASLAIAATALFSALLLNHHLHESELSGLQSSVPLLSKSRVSDEDKPRFYRHQLVDHFSDDPKPEYWSNRYYQSTKHFAGRGNPIFLVIGGEGATDDGMFYPFVTEVLAKRFKAAVIQVEHRFYGPYLPIENATVPELLQLLTPHQAMSDMVRLVGHVRDHEFGCSSKRHSKHYCPIVTVGASYPGFLSAMFRVVYPNFVDIAYASSAPLLMYAQAVDQDVYYDIVTAASERTSPGCTAAVKTTLFDTVQTIQEAANLLDAINTMGVCADTFPAYMKNQEMFQEALIQITSFKFADENMGNYPPGPETGLYKTCQIFQQNNKSSLDIMKDFLMSLDENADDDNTTCFDLMTQVPKGEGTTLEDTDGDYNDGMSWDFQTCTDIIFLLGFSAGSMFPDQAATYEHLAEHCRKRFGVTPRPWELVEKWGFDDLSEASNIIFTNGLQDMWSGGSYTWNVSDTVVAINFENGAHHSDLTHRGPCERDTYDIKQGFEQIQSLLKTWLHELPADP